MKAFSAAECYSYIRAAQQQNLPSASGSRCLHIADANFEQL